MPSRPNRAQESPAMDSATTAYPTTAPCQHCGWYHVGVACPLVVSVEYYQDGRLI